jgi:hypothetical protein
VADVSPAPGEAAPAHGSAAAPRASVDKVAEALAMRSRSGPIWAARCPGAWLSLVAVLVYGSLAIDRVENYVGGSYDFGVILRSSPRRACSARSGARVRYRCGACSVPRGVEAREEM